MRGLMALAAVLALVPVAAMPAGDKVVTLRGVEYVVPAASPVANPVASPGEDIEVRFAGGLVLSGTFHVQGNSENRMTILKPDASVAARLPRRKDDARPSEIWFENSEDAIKAIVDVPTLARLNAGKLDAYDKHVALDVDRYTIRIECDVSTYTVHFLKVHTPATLTAQAVEIGEGC